MKSEKEIRKMMTKIDMVRSGKDIEVRIDGMINFIDFWEGQVIFQTALRWVLEDSK